MNGYIYDPVTRKIATKVCNVTKCNETTVKGDGTAKVGTGLYVITEAEYEERDILPVDIEDKREQIPVLVE